MHLYITLELRRTSNLFMRLLITIAITLLSVSIIAQKSVYTAPTPPKVDTTDVPVDRVVVPEVQDSSITIVDSLTMMEPALTELSIRGKVYSALITEEGDTLIMDVFNDISITSMRSFDDDADYKKYLKQRRYASKVYPYAREAIRIFREVEWAEENLKKRDRKKRIKELEKELKAEFEEPLTRLTKLQGKIMIKMIEQELDETMYNLIKSVRGRFTAFYWHNFSKLYSYNLKEGYHKGVYPILDAVLSDFDVSFRLQSEEDLKYLRKKN